MKAYLLDGSNGGILIKIKVSGHPDVLIFTDGEQCIVVGESGYESKSVGVLHIQQTLHPEVRVLNSIPCEEGPTPLEVEMEGAMIRGRVPRDVQDALWLLNQQKVVPAAT